MSSLIHSFFYESPLYVVVLLTHAYFIFLYFFIGRLYYLLAHYLMKTGWVRQISNFQIKSSQHLFEKKNSLISILVFGFSSIPVVALYRNNYWDLQTVYHQHILVGVLLISLWNEIHFYLVHKLMHLPFFMKKVHWVHHRSVHPTLYSAYSFHWFEALLLSTVPSSILLIIPIHPVSIIIYPFISILFNLSAHSNYCFVKGPFKRWKQLGTVHFEHHSKNRNSYGFALSLLDKLFNKPRLNK